MNKTLLLWTCAIISIMVIPTAFAVNVGSGIGVDIETEDYVPQVFMCDRSVFDDATEPGRTSNDGENLTERTQNYAFEGEQISWEVLVFDKNGVQKISDVYGTVGDVQGANNPIEVNCVEKILPANITILTNGTAQYYGCTLTVETPLSMYGEHWITVEAIDLDGVVGTMKENEYWFLNPVVALSIEGVMEFDSVRPGTASYSNTILVGNDADDSSGVQLDMFISGTDFYDSSNSGAACPETNQLRLGNGDSLCNENNQGQVDPFCYFATHGAYDTLQDNRRDAEGYVGINYGIGFNDPNPFYGAANGDGSGHEIIQGLQVGPYFPGNVLTPGSEVAITFRLMLPEPCNGDFDTGSIFFWGEAI